MIRPDAESAGRAMQTEEAVSTDGKPGVLERLNAFRKALSPLWFLLPAILLLGFWIYRPFIQTIYFSFIKWNMLPTSKPVSVGLKNYEMLLKLPDFSRALLNTLWYILGMLPFSVVIPAFLAIVTEDLPDRAKNIYRAIFFLPMIMPPVTVSTIWEWLFHPTNGFINFLLIKLGLIHTGINFLNGDKTAILSIIIIAGWKMIGFSTLMFSAALTGIDKSYYEAADIDGVSKFRQMFTITIPLLSSMVIFLFMLNILFTAQWTFVYIDVLTQGGPSNATTNVFYLMYTYGLQNLDVGMSSAAAILFFILFGFVAVLLTRMNSRISFYDD